MNIRVSNALIAVFLWTVSSFSVAEDSVAKQGRELIETYQNVLVHVEGVATITATVTGQGANKQDVPFVVQGTVLTGDGLILASYNSMDGTYINSSLKMMQATGMIEVEQSGTISNLKVRYPDGKELPAKMILKDRDMDLAFIVPVKKVSDQKHLDTSKPGKAQIFDQVISLSRGLSVDKYIPLLSTSRIMGIMERPYIQYLASVSAGTPVFSADGKIVGFGVIRTDVNSKMNGGQMVQPRVAILPVEEVMDLVKQI